MTAGPKADRGAGPKEPIAATDAAVGPLGSGSARSAGWKIALGYVFALACLAWVFHHVRLRDLAAAISAVRWAWIPVAIAFDVASYACQGWRWSLLLRPVGRIGVIRATQAIYAGLLINELLPMRFGEVLRAYLAGRWIRAGFARIVPSIVVERFLDGIWVALAIGLIAMLVPLPKPLARAGDLLGVIVLASTVGFLGIVFAAERKPGAASDGAAGTGSTRRPGRFARLVGHLAAEVRAIGLSRPFWGAFGATFLLLAFQGVAFWIILRACRINVSLWAGMAVFLLVHLGTAIPNAPGNVGSYQFFVVIGLAVFGVEKSPAAAFSLVVFVLLTAPFWALGWFSLSRAGLSLGAVRQEIARSRTSAGTSVPGR